jgi:Spy/CpxP family protein refolding chaperone
MRKTLSVLLLSVIFTVPAFAEMHDMEMKEHEGHKECQCDEHKMEKGNMDKMGDMMGRCLKHADKLGLTDEQVVKLKVIHRAMEIKDIRLEADQKIAKLELMEIIEVKDFDLEKANAAVQKISDIERNKHLEMLKTMKEVRSILTDDQFKKMKEMMSMMMGDKKPEMKKHKEPHQK